MKKIFILVVVAVISFSFFGAVQSEVPVNAEPAESQTDGLIGWWKFNDTPDSISDDSSINNNGGTNNNMSAANQVTDVPAVCSDSNDYALSLNPGGQEDNQWVEVGVQSDLQPTSITVSAWIKANDSGNFGQIVGAAGFTKGVAGYSLFYSGEYNTIEFAHSNGYINFEATGGDSLEGQWRHVSATYDETSGVTNLYIDGLQVAFTTNDPEPMEHDPEFFDDAPYSFQIGRAQYTDLETAGMYEGLVDDVRVYDYALSEEEIENLSAEGDCGASNEDLNGDEIPDSEQPNVSGYVSSLTGKVVAIDVGSDCELTTDDITQESNLAVQDPAFEYVNGLWDWEAECVGETTTVKLYYYNVPVEGLVARKFSTITNSYFTLTGATFVETTINGQPVTIVTYQITDNSALDMNPEVGMIEDPAGVGVSVLGAPQTGVGGTASGSSSLDSLSFL